jgi:rhodanese-related sulfurtransferase
MTGITRRSVRILAAAALGLGLLAAFAGNPDFASSARVDVRALARNVESEEDHVTAIELAQWIKDRRPGLRVVDVRPADEFDAYHIPTAEDIPLDKLVDTPFRKAETIVLYSGGGAHAAQGWVFLRALGLPHVYFLRDGLTEWLEDVINPVISAAPTDSARKSFAHAADLSRYFGGVPRAGEPATVAPQRQPNHKGLAKKDSTTGSIAAAVLRIRGRGC